MCIDIKNRTQSKIAAMDQKIRAFKKMKRSLGKLLAACDGRASVAADECAILASLDRNSCLTLVTGRKLYGDDSNVVLGFSGGTNGDFIHDESYLIGKGLIRRPSRDPFQPGLSQLV